MLTAQEEAISDEESSEKTVLRVPAIKCDRNKPCSSCVASKISCQTTKRPPEKRQRVLLSRNYGQEISDVNKRLSDLSNTIHALVESNKQIAVQVSSASPFVHTVSPPATSVKDDLQDTPFEGESSFTSQSKTITEALGVALGGQPHAIDNTLSANSTVQKLLDDVTAENRRQPTASSQIGQYPELSQQSLPPMAPVLKLLRLAKEEPQRFFFEYPLVTVEKFTDLCQNVYFPMKDPSMANWICVNVGLFNLFRWLENKSLSQIGISREQGLIYADICTSNVITSAHSLRITIEVSLDNVEAMVMAAALSMELAKASLAWNLTASAARMLLDLGVHRQPPGLTTPQSRRERILFWFVYSLDKGLSLNFGRTPNIHDYDLTIERPRVKDDVHGVYAEYYVGWVDYAQIQGDIYSQLFCAQAQQQPQEVRASRAYALACRCIDLRSKLLTLDVSDGLFKAERREAVLSADVTMSSLLTLIYRTLPPPADAHPLQFSDECVHAARQALKLLAEAWQELQPKDDDAWKLFVNWTVLYVPFIPFIVVFGNTIAKSSHDDLLLLEGTVRTLRGASQSTPAINKLRDACEKFCQIAAAFLAQEAAGPSRFEDTNARAMGDSPVPNVNSALPSSMTELGPMDFQALSDFPTQQGAWDGMLNEWDLGLGAENARDMTDWFGQYMDTAGSGFR